MDINHFLVTILSGVIGTLAMTAFMYLYAYSTSHFTKVIHILGNMLVGERNYYSPTKSAFLVGMAAHFGVGILFSFAYFLLWNWGIFRIDLIDSILIGSISGVLAVVVWKSYLKLHTHPPQINLLHYFTALFIAHIIFAVVSVYVFRIIIDDPEFWYKTQSNLTLM